MLSQMEQIYTLAQSGTTKTEKPLIAVVGKGSEITESKVVKGRAKRKLITQTMSLSLVDVSKAKKKPINEKSYWNTYHCQNKVTSSGGLLFGSYCKNRFCTLCLSIRKAEIINKYLPVIQTWEEPYFTTLTIRSCSARNLKKMTDGMIRAFTRIKSTQKKRHQRGTGIQLIGVKSLECNFNPKTRTYNPHFHLIVKNKEIAELITKEWLKIWTSTHTSSKAQFSRPVKDTTRDLIEIIKYGSKIFTEPDVKQKVKGKGIIYASALDNILQAMKDHRIFDRFGFNLPQIEKTEIQDSIQLISEYEEWSFNPAVSDWENIENDEKLSGYFPPEELVKMITEQIDVELE